MPSRKTVVVVAAVVVFVSCQVMVRNSRQKTERPLTYLGREPKWWAYEITHWNKITGRYSGPLPLRESAFLEVVRFVTGVDYGAVVAVEGDGGLRLHQGDPEAVPMILELADHSDSAVRLNSAACLYLSASENVGGVGVRDRLKLMLEDEDEHVREFTRQAFLRLLFQEKE